MRSINRRYSPALAGFLCGLLAVAPGCKKESKKLAPAATAPTDDSASDERTTEGQTSPAHGQGDDQGDGEAGAARRGQAAPTPALAEAQVGALIDAWVAAQNAGNFEEYSKLYAPNFQGVRRSGDKKVELARDAWMSERARMFKRPMHMAVAGRTIAIAQTRATVEFVQTWESGKYADRGPKRITVEKIGDAALITSEDMLSSARIPVSDAPLFAMYPEPEDRPTDPMLDCTDLDQKGDTIICMVVTEIEGCDVSVDIGLLRRHKLTYKVLDRDSLSYSVDSTGGNPFGDEEEDIGLSESADASLGGPIEIGEDKIAVEVELTASSSISIEAGTTHSGEQVVLVTAIGDQLVELLRLESESKGDTDYDGKTEQSYEILSSVGDDGFYDISVTTESESNEWPTNELSSESKTSIVRYSPGSGYE